MRRRQWFDLATTGVMLAWLVTPARTLAFRVPPRFEPSELSKLQQKVITLSLDLLKADALADELKDEARVLTIAQEGTETVDTRSFRAPEKVWISAFPPNLAKDRDSDGVLKNLAGAHREIEKQQKESTRAWTSASQRMLELQAGSAETEAMIGWRMGSQSAKGALSPELIGPGFVAVLGALVLLAHENRDRLRWRLRALGSRPSLLIVAMVVPLAAASGAWSAPAEEAARKTSKAEPSLGILAPGSSMS